MLNVVNFGGGTYVLYAEVRGDADRGRPRALRRQLRPPRAAAAARGEGAGGGDRPDRRPPARGLARRPRARRSSTRSATTRPRRASRSRPRRATTPRSRAWSPGRSSRRRLLKIEYYKENEDEFTERTLEPYKLVNGQRGLVRRTRGTCEKDSSALVPARPRAPGGRARRQLRAAPGRGARRARAGCAPARSTPAARRASGSHPSGPAGSARTIPCADELSDGAVIFERTYASYEWLAREILKEAGDAVVLEPEEARARGAGSRRASCRHGVTRSRCPTRRWAPSSAR